MMGEDPMSGEEGLRDLFAGLRREEEASAPPFFTGDTARRQNAFERRPGWLNPSAIVAALCAAAVVAALLWQRRDPVPEPRPGGAVTSITEWRPPTDFLLDTPGRELLQSTPAIGVSHYLLPLPPHRPRRTRIDGTTRANASP